MNSRTPRLSDVGLMLWRLLIVVVVGVALAAPVFESRRETVRRVLLLDVSTDALSVAEVRDSAAVYFTVGDAVVLFDGGQLDSLPEEGTYPTAVSQIGRGQHRSGSLTAGLVGALRAAQQFRHHADSVELVLVSPLLESQFDAATLDVRELWSGRIRVVRVAGRSDPGAWARAIDVRMDPGDPITASLSLLGVRTDGGDRAYVRLVRGGPTAADTLWLNGESEGGEAEGDAAPDAVHVRTLVVWPTESAMDALNLREAADTIGGVVISRRAVVANFQRSTQPGDGTAIAHWADGEPAAVERAHGGGCMREVAIPLSTVGDLALRNSFLHLTDELLRPCGHSRDVAAASDSLVSLIAGAGPLAEAAALGGRERRSAVAPWLLGLALLLGAIEPVVRDRRRQSA